MLLPRSLDSGLARTHCVHNLHSLGSIPVRRYLTLIGFTNLNTNNYNKFVYQGKPYQYQSCLELLEGPAINITQQNAGTHFQLSCRVKDVNVGLRFEPTTLRVKWSESLYHDTSNSRYKLLKEWNIMSLLIIFGIRTLNPRI